MNLTFFNNYNNGDIHVSREFIKDIIKKTNPFEVLYYHKNSPRILLDIPEVKTINSPSYGRASAVCNKSSDTLNIDIFHINTWYRSIEENFKKYGCTLDCLYENFKFIYRELGIEIEPKEFYIPSIDFSKYQIAGIDDFLKNNTQRKIFISNGTCLSNQSPPINWDPLISTLSTTYPSVLFFITNPAEINSPNCIQTKNIIGDIENDLCENAYISTKCDVLIGNNSGAHTFSYVKENIIGDKEQLNVMISFYPEFTNLYNYSSKEMMSIKHPKTATFNIIEKLNDL